MTVNSALAIRGEVHQPAPPRILTGSTPGPVSRNAKVAIVRASGEAARGNLLGIEAGPAVVAGGKWGLKVSKVDLGTSAEKAGLRVGDVIESINGFVTAKQSDLAWVIADASSSKALAMSVRSARDGKVRTMTAQLP